MLLFHCIASNGQYGDGKNEKDAMKKIAIKKHFMASEVAIICMNKEPFPDQKIKQFLCLLYCNQKECISEMSDLPDMDWILSPFPADRYYLILHEHGQQNNGIWDPIK